jgi:RNA-binding protein 39
MSAEPISPREAEPNGKGAQHKDDHKARKVIFSTAFWVRAAPACLLTSRPFVAPLQEERRRDRSDSRSRRRRSRSRSREREERPRRRRSRSRSRGGRRDRSRSRSRSRDRRGAGRDHRPDFRRRETPRERHYGGYGGGGRRISQATGSAEDELVKLDRTTRTVQVYNLNLKAEERDMFELFGRAGPLVDIKIIRDRTTGRSKGFAYVEYQEKESVIPALSLTGQPLLGQAVMVKMSEAEKNMAWEAAQAAKRQQAAAEAAMGPGGYAGAAGGAAALAAAGGAGPGVGPCRLAVSNLHPSITEADLRPIFDPFGTLDFVALQRDALGGSLGTALVQ